MLGHLICRCGVAILVTKAPLGADVVTAVVLVFPGLVVGFKVDKLNDRLGQQAEELQMLVLASLLSIGLAFPPLIALILRRGLIYAAGNRDESSSLPAWGQRAERAQKNLLANLPAFAALVLVATATGITNESTAWGAEKFFWARIAHASVYIAGIPYFRTVAFVVSLDGMFDIARELIGAWSTAPPAT